MVEGVKSIEISDFVPYEEIDPIYFERTYFLGPRSGAAKRGKGSVRAKRPPARKQPTTRKQTAKR